MTELLAQVTYLAVSIGVIVWVVGSLDRHSPRLLAVEFDPAHPVSRSLTSMLVTSFYLLAIGLTLMNAHSSADVPLTRVIEQTSVKVGFVILGLAGAHFAIVGALLAFRREVERDSESPPPLPRR